VPFFERFDLQPDNNNITEISLVWTEKNHADNYFDATNFSDGTIRFIALVTLLLQPNLPKTINRRTRIGAYIHLQLIS
jgi:predicted ATPase